jgi:NADH dehydrogenase (ubiquinone) 1 beta subcomplex subunit 8
MLSRRIARASALASARPLPAIQQRTFIHKPIKGRQEELYPDEPTLTEAEDPGMVCGLVTLALNGRS